MYIATSAYISQFLNNNFYVIYQLLISYIYNITSCFHQKKNDTYNITNKNDQCYLQSSTFVDVLLILLALGPDG